MNDFVTFVLQHLKTAIWMAVAAAVLCALIVGVCWLVFKRRYHGERRFPWGKIMIAVLFIGYLVVLLYATLLRFGGGYGVNLHPFMALREAWNLYSLKNWLNPLLNVALFIPLGVLLPLLAKPFQKAYFMLAAGFGGSLMIELAQYIAHSGISDVDDLMANTLGAMLGYCFLMMIVTLTGKHSHKGRRTLAYAVLPLLSVFAIVGTAAAYELQEFGNLECAATHRVSMNGIEVTVACVAEDESLTAPVYQAKTYTSAECDEFGYGFLAHIGETENLDVAYYDNETWYMDHAGTAHFLIVSHRDRSYTYSVHDGTDAQPTETDRETLVSLLEELAISVPEQAAFSYEGNGWHTFSLDMYIDGDTLLDGTLRCRYKSNGSLAEAENRLVSYTLCRDAELISQSEAISRFSGGHFNSGEFEYLSPSSAEIQSISLDYAIDSKGFYQPVYILAVRCDDASIEVAIPALAA